MTGYLDPTVNQLPDTAIIRRIVAGEKELFELIVRRYNQRLYRTGMAVLGNDSEVEDMMQNAYINAYEHLAGFEQRSQFATWLTRIMLNLCFAQKRKRQILSSTDQASNCIHMTTPENLLVNKELSKVLEQAIERLPEKYRLVFVLREIEQLSVRETSELLQIHEPNVKVRLNRARTMLKSDLSGYMQTNIYNFHLTRCDSMVLYVLSHIKNG
jgi:RNA polymerase sigma-70 factor (ECF subfamily)